MKIEIDECELTHEIVWELINGLRDTFGRGASKEALWWDRQLDDTIQKEVAKIIEENKDKLLDNVAERAADKFHNDIKLKAILSVLAEKDKSNDKR